MDIDFCYVGDPADAEHTLSILKQHGRVAQRIGTAVSDPQKIVRIPARGLAGQHSRVAARALWPTASMSPSRVRHLRSRRQTARGSSSVPWSFRRCWMRLPVGSERAPTLGRTSRMCL
jgi:hypothetical protein